jgi:uncharacterized protein (TIGR03437 family)
MILSVTRFLLIAAASALLALGQSASPSTIIGAGYLFPSPINVAPGQIITVFAAGVGSTLTQPVFAGAGNWPTSLAGISVTIQQGKDIPAPIFEVNPIPTCGSCGAMTAITIQIPYGLITACGPSLTVCPNVVVLTGFFVSENGVAGTLSELTPLSDRLHILTACDTVLAGGSGYVPGGGLPCQPEVTHADGTLVSEGRPATVGEELVAYAVGLGATNPPVPAGQPATEPVPTVESFTLSFDSYSLVLAARRLIARTTPLAPLFTGLTPGYPGLYQINFVVPPLPSGALPCAFGGTPVAVPANLTVSVIGSASSDYAAICVSL